MSSPVNPILVIRNNLPEYREEVLAKIVDLTDRLAVLKTELETLDALASTLEQQDRRQAATPTYYVTGQGVPEAAAWDCENA